MVAGFLLVESGLWVGGRLMRSHMEATSGITNLIVIANACAST
jgi:hypothetical protein